jgi:hypothetical protein
VGITPIELSRVPIIINISVADIDTSNESGMPVYNNYFPMIAVIDPVGEDRKVNFEKSKYFYLVRPHSPNKLSADRTAAKVVMCSMPRLSNKVLVF